MLEVPAIANQTLPEAILALSQHQETKAYVGC